jgi:hypothetical protein
MFSLIANLKTTIRKINKEDKWIIESFNKKKEH